LKPHLFRKQQFHENHTHTLIFYY